MPTPEQPSQPDQASGEQQEQERFKTIAVRVQEDLHAQLSFIAQLAGSNISEEIRTAIENRIATAQADPDVIAKAEAARHEIRREAEARAAAIAGFMGKQAVAATPKRPSTPKRRTPAKNSDK